MKKVYIASTIHTHDWNPIFNPKLCDALEAKGVTCFLAQRDSEQDGEKIVIYQQDIAGIKNSEKLLCVAENESVNWGGEVGFAKGIGKKIIALQQKNHEIPLMIKFMIDEVVKVEDLENIDGYIDELVEKINL